MAAVSSASQSMVWFIGVKQPVEDCQVSPGSSKGNASVTAKVNDPAMATARYEANIEPGHFPRVNKTIYKRITGQVFVQGKRFLAASQNSKGVLPFKPK
jgi:hypothetical protein